MKADAAWSNAGHVALDNNGFQSAISCFAKATGFRSKLLKGLGIFFSRERRQFSLCVLSGARSRSTEKTVALHWIA